MATDPNTPTPAGSNKMLWIIIILLLLIMVTGGAVAGTYFLMSDSSANSDGAHAEQEESKPPAKPVFVALEPFTVNLRDDAGRILYLRLSLKVGDDEQAARLTEHMPQVRNRILIDLTDAEADRLTTRDGKRALAASLQQTIAEPFIADAEPIGVSDVLFTDFIVQ